MLKKYTFFLAFNCIFFFSANTQTYEQQFVKCSEALKALGTSIDSLYFARLQERDSCLTGCVAPNFEATSVDGKKIELSKLKGQVIVLNFWFTKCQPCIEEMPTLNNLVEHYSDKEVQFISFAPEDATTLLKFFQAHPFKFITIAASEDIRRNKFKLFSAWPYTIIIDREGRINKMWVGNPGKEVFDYYQKIIDRLL